MSKKAQLLEVLRLLAAAGYIDGKVFIRGDDGAAESQAHVHAVDVCVPRRRHLVSI
jgi:hypothetical protein